jgi:hypothetical protein
VSQILQDSWFKKGYVPAEFEVEEDKRSLKDVNAVFGTDVWTII